MITMTSTNDVRADTPSRPAAPATDDWRHLSSCLTEDPELFFPDGTTGAALNQMEMARQVCLRCPVQLECLRLALSTGTADGVWGGTTPEERRRIRRGSSAAELRTMDAHLLAATHEPAERARPLSYEERLALEARAPVPTPLPQ